METESVRLDVVDKAFEAKKRHNRRIVKAASLGAWHNTLTWTTNPGVGLFTTEAALGMDTISPTSQRGSGILALGIPIVCDHRWIHKGALLSRHPMVRCIKLIRWNSLCQQAGSKGKKVIDHHPEEVVATREVSPVKMAAMHK